MTLNELRDLVRKWDSENSDSRYDFILNRLDYYATREWRVYLPAEHPDFNASYMERLATWIDNVADEADQKLLLEYALHISFFSHDDFAALYRTALDREVTRWVAKQIGAQLQSNGIRGFQDLIHSQIHRHTWFCPVTDSMDINEFYKVNHLKGVGHRPHFATLQMLAECCTEQDPKLANNIVYYMNNPSLDPTNPLPSLERIVLLEDIVGSSSQCIKAVQWAVTNLNKPVLFVPLILCPNGAKVLRQVVQNSNGSLAVQPVIELCRSDLLGDERENVRGWPIAEKLENLISRCDTQTPFNYDPFGYRKTGCSLVTFSNTPDNTPPIVHDKAKSGAWHPLFPRIFRDN